jgi:hypothetical protein
LSAIGLDFGGFWVSVDFNVPISGKRRKGKEKDLTQRPLRTQRATEEEKKESEDEGDVGDTAKRE